MIAFPAGAKVWIAGGATDMRGGMNSLALKVQQGLGRDPHSHEVFCFRGRKGDLIKVLWHDGVGMSLYLKRLEAGKFIWPASENGAAVQVSAAQLGLLNQLSVRYIKLISMASIRVSRSQARVEMETRHDN